MDVLYAADDIEMCAGMALESDEASAQRFATDKRAPAANEDYNLQKIFQMNPIPTDFKCSLQIPYKLVEDFVPKFSAASYAHATNGSRQLMIESHPAFICLICHELTRFHP